MNFCTAAQRHSFIEDNMKLVTARVKRLNNGVYDADMFQEGIIGLLEAADRFDPGLGFAFSTYAVSYIDGAIRGYKGLDYIGQDVYSLDKFADDGDITLGDTVSSDYDMECAVVETVFMGAFLNKLRARERDVLRLQANGFTHKEISERVGVHKNTIGRILKDIRTKYIREARPCGLKLVT